MHQHADGSVDFKHSGPRGGDAEIHRILRALLGEVPLRIEKARFEDGKVVQYTSDLT